MSDPSTESDFESGPEQRSLVLLVLSSVVSVVVLGGALAAPVIARVAGYERAPADLSAVVTYEVTDRSHTDEDLDYPQSPPVGGDHAPAWLACGVYDEPVREENAVHDLEHGTVWITHDPSLPERDVELLADVLPDNGIMSPRDGPAGAGGRHGLGRAARRSTAPTTSGWRSSSRSTATGTPPRSWA